jgi:C1A family cysteine protease
LVNRKPVASYIATGGIKFFLYKKGIINECKDTTLDHAVLIVGFSYNQIYGKYWIIKNTLGMSWGDDGYGHISMSNDCGLLKHGYIASL